MTIARENSASSREYSHETTIQVSHGMPHLNTYGLSTPHISILEISLEEGYKLCIVMTSKAT